MLSPRGPALAEHGTSLAELGINEENALIVEVGSTKPDIGGVSRIRIE